MVKGSYSKNVIDIEARFAVKGAEEFEKSLGKTSDVAKSITNDNIDNTRKQGEALTSLEARTAKYNEIGKEFNTNQAETGKLLGAAGFQIDKTGNVIDKAGASVDDYTTGMKENVSVLSKFQMENLGVMFAGMALDRAMTNLNATSREWLGIGELTSTMMGITMLSANMDLLEFGVLPLFDALTNLPPVAQKSIGLLSIALEGLGGMMFVGGQLMLGLDSTATLLSKIAGVSPTLIFTEKGLGALGTKLSGSMDKIKKLGKLAGAGITIAMALQDLEEGQITAAVGDVFMAAGFLKGGKVGGALFIAGIGLKLIGEGEFTSSIAKLGIIMLEMLAKPIEWLSDSISALFSAEEIDWGSFNNLMDEFDKEALKRVEEGTASRFLTTRMTDPQQAAEGFGNFVTSAIKFRLNPIGSVTGKIREIIFSPTYNVSVSDKREFETMIRENNTKQVNDLQRMSVLR